MVTLEVALAIPLILLVAVAAALLLMAGQLQARVTDAARSAARDVARGQSPEEAAASAARVLPGARFDISIRGAEVEVRAEHEMRGPGPLLDGIRRRVTATVVTVREEYP